MKSIKVVCKKENYIWEPETLENNHIEILDLREEKINSEIIKQFCNGLNKLEERISKLKAMSIIKIAEVKARNKKGNKEVEEEEGEEEEEK